MSNKEIIKKSDGKPFSKKGHAVNALRLKGLSDTYEVIEYEGGGYVCIPKNDDKLTTSKEQVLPAVDKQPKTKKVKIYRSSGAPENQDLVISVCVNNPKNRKKFYPGEEVELTITEIDVLRNSVEENALFIPPDSGIYQAKEPLSVARNQYPGMAAGYDHVTGLIKMVKRTPNYMIEEVQSA